MKKILVIGATSAIAQAAARVWAVRGDSLCLVGRDAERIEALAADLRVRGAPLAVTLLLDANDFARHAVVIDEAFARLGGVDIAFIAHGSLPDQRACELDFDAARRELDTNAVSVISLLTRLAGRLEAQPGATIAVIGSVAGDRSRQSNYVYGAAKAAVAVFLQGLRNRLHARGVHVLTVKPGFVDTPMTAAFDKGPLWASAEHVGRAIVSAIDRRVDVAYVPGFWRWIMAAIRGIPEGIFKRMKL